MKSITIELTQQCPNQCLHCSSFGGECSPPVLRPYEIERIIEEAHELGATEVAFSGGEPLIQMTSLIAGIKKAKSLGMQSYVYTSGLVPSDQTLSHSEVQPLWMWSTLKSYDKNLIPIFDIPTLDCGMYDFFTMYDRLHERWPEVCPERRLSRILLLMCNIYSRIGLCPQINFVPMRINCNAFEFVLQWATEHKMKMNVLAYVEQGRAKKYSNWLSMSWKEFDYFCLIAYEMSQLIRGKTLTDKPVPRYDLRIGTPLSGGPKCGCSCTACSEKCVIRYDGKIIGCEALKQLSIINGDLDTDPNKVFARDIRTMSLAEAIGPNSNFGATLSAIKSILERVKVRTPCPVQNLMYNHSEANIEIKLERYRNE